MQIELHNSDCMDYLHNYSDNHFDLAIVDPPYGINIGEKAKSFSGKYFTNGIPWDIAPDKEYFDQLMRISKNQIIWGANYFLDYLPSTKCMIIWDKYNTNKGRFADGEIAWTNFDKPTRVVTYEWLQWYQPDMKNKQIRIHPTQKPTQLYDWLYFEYSCEDANIIDTHGGSMTSVISGIKMNQNIVCFEIDKQIYNRAKKRIIDFANQLDIFNELPKIIFKP